MRSTVWFRSLSAPILFALLAVVLSPAPARSQEKKFGYDSKAGGGKGAEFTAAEKTKITDALTKIKDMTFTTKNGTYKGSDIEKDLKKMLEDGRMGKGVGAKKGTYATTKGDGKATTDGDLMNIADHHIKDGDNKNLSNTLVHEWLHTKQTGGTEAEDETPAYQVGRQAYLDKGGAAGDAPAKSDQSAIDKYKKILDAAKTVVPDSKVPDKSTDKKRSHCGHEYEIEQNPGKLYFWSSTLGYVDSVIAGINRQFFDCLVYPNVSGCDRLLIFGSDLSSPSNPQGIMTVVDANASGFTSRTDFPMPGVRYPFSVTQDTISKDLYVLDAHFGGQGILRMQNLDSDVIPDNILPFAPRGFPGVDSAEAVVWADVPGIGPGLAIDPMDAREDDNLVPGEHLTLLRDTNADGLADVPIELVELQLTSFAPHFTSPPLPGGLQVEVQAMPGHALQVQLTDANGDFNFGVIGNGIGDPGWGPQFLPLFAPLVAGQYVKVVDATDATQAALPTLVAPLVPGTNPALLALVAFLLAAAGALALGRRRTAAQA